MTLGQTLIDAASRGCPHGNIAIEEAASVFLKKHNPDGGFRGKGPQSDLYYTGFALMSLNALGQSPELPNLNAFLDGFADGQGLDLAHLAALIRCRRLTGQLDAASLSALAAQLETFHCADGAYHHLRATDHGSAYGCFLALGAYEDLGQHIPDARAMVACIEKLNADGGYYNEAMLPIVSAPGTAAAVTVLRHLGQPVDPGAADWLFKSRDADGGFKVMPAAPVADLLSTAVSLYALQAMGADLSAIGNADIAFVSSLWDHAVGFCQNRIDSISDCEYSFYGLLSLGTLK